MSNGWHIYSCPPSGEPRLLKTVNTPAQARKNEFYYPSVTGVLGLLPNPFMAKWRGRKMVELSKENPGKEAEELEQLAWGTRTCPETGEEISSSDFGTRAHAAIENWFKREGEWDGLNPYELTVNETLRYLNTHFTYRYAEKILCCHDLKIAGTVDYIGQDNFGKWMLADFKFRDVKEGTKATPYDKDRAQLAVESEMWKNDLGLDYDPDIYSIIVDVNTGTPHVTKHSEKMRRKGLQFAGVAAYVYWNLPGYGYVENTEDVNASLRLPKIRNLNRIPVGQTRVECGGWFDFMKTPEIQRMIDRAYGLNVCVDAIESLPKNASKKRLLEALESIEGQLYREHCDQEGAVDAIRSAIEGY